jgi:anti-anti-sigma regulatory factor
MMRSWTPGNATALTRALTTAGDDGGNTTVADLTAVTLVSIVGLRSVLTAAASARARNHRVVTVMGPGLVRRTFALTAR